MPVCEYCGGEDFEILVGHYFCATCQMQADDVVPEEEVSFSQQWNDNTDDDGNSHTFKPVRPSVAETVRKKCELGKEIKPMSTMQIVQMIFDRLLEEYCNSLPELRRQQMVDLSSRVMDSYSQWIKSTCPSDDVLSHYFTLRDFFFIRYPEKFYLLYVYDSWKYVTEREIYKLKKKKKRAKARKKKAKRRRKTEPTVAEQTGPSQDHAPDTSFAEDGLLREHWSSEDGDFETGDRDQPSTSWSLAPLWDSKIEDNYEDLDSEEFESEDSELVAEGRKLSSDMFEEEEHKILLEASHWVKSTQKKCSHRNYVARPSPRLAYSVMYLVAVMRNETILFEQFLFHIYCNKVPLLDLVSFFPELVLTPHEVTVDVNVDIGAFIRLMRKSAHRLYRILFTTMESISLSDIEMDANDTDLKCERVLDMLNLPRSLNTLAARLMNEFRNKVVSTKYRQPRSIVPECFFEYDVYFFVAVFVVKHVVVDSARHHQIKALSVKWYKWAHNAIFESVIPSHFVIFAKQPGLMCEKAIHDYPKAVNRIQTMVMRNRFHFYRRFGMPSPVRKKLTLWEMAKGTPDPERLFEDYAVFLDKKVERILTLPHADFQRDFGRDPPLNEVVLLLNQNFIFDLIIKKCEPFALYRGEIKCALENEERMNVAVVNKKLENRFWGASTSTSPPEGLEARGRGRGRGTTMTMKSDESMDRETHLKKLEEKFKQAIQSGIEVKEGVEAFGIYDQLFFLLAGVSGSKFRCCVSEFLLMLGSD